MSAAKTIVKSGLEMTRGDSLRPMCQATCRQAMCQATLDLGIGGNCWGNRICSRFTVSHPNMCWGLFFVLAQARPSVQVPTLHEDRRHDGGLLGGTGGLAFTAFWREKRSAAHVWGAI